MSNFLNKVAQSILSKHRTLKNVALVLPSRRAALFLKKELAAQLSKPDWAPYITTVDDFVLQSQSLKQAEQAELIFKLFESYQQTYPTKQENFADFNKWAHLLLADFNELDRYLINTAQLFSYLADVKRIERWNLKPEEETPMLKQYLAFWENLHPLYLHFTQQLLQNKTVYQGLAYRQMVQHLPNIIAEAKITYEQFYFIGFNALNAAEEQLFLKFYEEGLAQFFWDVDAYYFNDEQHEAGRFLRKSKLVQKLKERNEFNWLENQLSTKAKNIGIYAAPGNHMQARAANALLSQIPDNEWTQTAVVLADEQLLVPFLNNLNASVSHLNITMGLALKNSPLASFFQLLWEMLIGSESRNEIGGEVLFYHGQWDKLLSTPHLKKVAKNPAVLDYVRDEIRQKKEVYLSLAKLQQAQLPSEVYLLFEPLLKELHTPASAMAALANLCTQLKQHLETEQQFMQSLYGFFKIFSELKTLFSTYNYVEDFKTAHQFYRQLLQSETLDLYGEPLKGLQLMGMLETRTLSFKRLVITSVNENILPSGRSQNSLIPFDIKREFNLPTYLEKDSVYAYHFYRLLQAADDISILYNSQLDSFGSGEASRFIAQLEFELKQVNNNINITHQKLQAAVHLNNQEHSIAKTEEVLNRLKQMAKKGFSPTSLSLYLTDPVRFYYQKVLGIKETKDLEEVIGFDTEGNVVHELLQELYENSDTKNYIDLNEATLQSLLTKGFLEQKVGNKLKEKGIKEIHTGKNLLTREMLIGMLQNAIKAEIQHLHQKPKLLFLEHDLTTEVPNNLSIEVNLFGQADRIDTTEQEIRILDYKTGYVNKQKLKVFDGAQLLMPEYAKAFQLCMYAYMYLKQNPPVTGVSSGIISLRNSKEWILPVKVNNHTLLTRDFIPQFETVLNTLLEELFDSTLPFTSRQALNQLQEHARTQQTTN